MAVNSPDGCITQTSPASEASRVQVMLGAWLLFRSYNDEIAAIVNVCRVQTSNRSGRTFAAPSFIYDFLQGQTCIKKPIEDVVHVVDVLDSVTCGRIVRVIADQTSQIPALLGRLH